MNNKTAKRLRKAARAAVNQGVVSPDKYARLYKFAKRAWRTNKDLLKDAPKGE